jgi:hypothetical protein
MATAQIIRTKTIVNDRIATGGQPQEQMLRIAKDLLFVEQGQPAALEQEPVEYHYSIREENNKIYITCDEVPELQNVTPQEYIDYIDQAMSGEENE